MHSMHFVFIVSAIIIERNKYTIGDHLKYLGIVGSPSHFHSHPFTAPDNSPLGVWKKCAWEKQERKRSKGKSLKLLHRFKLEWMYVKCSHTSWQLWRNIHKTKRSNFSLWNGNNLYRATPSFVELFSKFIHTSFAANFVAEKLVPNRSYHRFYLIDWLMNQCQEVSCQL